VIDDKEDLEKKKEMEEDHRKLRKWSQKGF